MALQDGALLTGGRIPDPYRSVSSAASQQGTAADGDLAHPVYPALVAFQGRTFASWPYHRPQRPVRRFPSAGAVSVTQLIERLGDAEQGRALAR